MSALGLRRLSTLPRRGSLSRDVSLVLAAAILGCALRVAASIGDLGLDEVWSLRLVGGVHAIGAVFWGISHDNNHMLNSAWLYLVGQDAPIWADRLPAVVLGTLTVPALAWLCGRSTPAAGALGALIGAVALPLVDFGSEARGYAGLALATVLALRLGADAVDAAESGDGSRVCRASWSLGATVGIGLLWHLTMAYTLAVLGLAVLIRAKAHRRPFAAAQLALRVAFPSMLLALPAFGFLWAGVLNRGTLTIGDADPFTLPKLVQGFGGMALLGGGLPDTLPPALGIASALTLLWAAARHRLASPWSIAVGFAALVALPLSVAALRLPNVGYSRYFAVCGIVLLVLLAEVLGTLWVRGGEARRLAAISAAALVAGHLILDGLEIRDGRGGITETLTLMSQEGAAAYTADRPFMAALLLDEAARRAGREAPTPVAEADLCRTPPHWFIAVGTFDPRPDGSTEAGAPACPARYDRRRAFQAAPLSGTQWTLYSRP